MQNAGLDDSQAGIKIARRNINSLRHENDTLLKAEGEEELKSFLMRVKEESEKGGLKLNIQEMKMASSPITSWHIEGEKVEAVTDFIFFPPKLLWMVTAAMKLKDTSWKKSYDIHSVLKSRDITLLTKIHVVEAMVISSNHVQMLELNHKEG